MTPQVIAHNVLSGPVDLLHAQLAALQRRKVCQICVNITENFVARGVT